jgi:hypothetical protein
MSSSVHVLVSPGSNEPSINIIDGGVFKMGNVADAALIVVTRSV